MDARTQPQPVAGAERIAALDILRGMALFGVLLVNLVYFSGHGYRQAAGLPIPWGPGDAMLVWLRDRFLYSKAIFCFSLLFGIGLGIQMERAKARGGFLPFALRRLGALALFGAAHALLIWSGDILGVYAVAGLVLLPVLGARPRVLAAAACAAFLAGVEGETLLRWVGTPDDLLNASWAGRGAWLAQAADAAYGRGTWLQAARWRAWEWSHVDFAFDLEALLRCLPLFLAGLALWRSGALLDPDRHRRGLARLFHATFWPGLALTLVPRGWLPGGGFPVHLLRAAAPLALALGYFTGGLLLLRRPGIARRLAPLASLGRMALTNYLAQSLVCTWLFNGYGLGLWNRLRPGQAMAFGLGFYLAQGAASRWWLRRFAFGPAEWLWRTLSYAKRPSR